MSIHSPATRRALLATAALFGGLSSSVTAQEAPGWYASVYGGLSRLASTPLNETRPSAVALDGQARFDNGAGFGGALGWRYGNGWAAEVAWDYRRHDLQRVGGLRVDGDFASNLLFVNGYHRFSRIGAIRPFVGAGVGWVQEIDIDIERAGRNISHSRSGGAAWQAIVGGEWELSPQWSLVADLRWMRVNVGRLKAENGGGGLIVNRPDYQPAAINLGLTYRFQPS